MQGLVQAWLDEKRPHPGRRKQFNLLDVRKFLIFHKYVPTLSFLLDFWLMFRNDKTMLVGMVSESSRFYLVQDDY